MTRTIDIINKKMMQKDRDDLLTLLRSGYAALDVKGDIVDRRVVKKIVKAFAKNDMLGIPDPIK